MQFFARLLLPMQAAERWEKPNSQTCPSKSSKVNRLIKPYQKYLLGWRRIFFYFELNPGTWPPWVSPDWLGKRQAVSRHLDSWVQVFHMVGYTWWNSSHEVPFRFCTLQIKRFLIMYGGELISVHDTSIIINFHHHTSLMKQGTKTHNRLAMHYNFRLTKS